jgi:23S rRNA pseudouridine2605 synthase
VVLEDGYRTQPAEVRFESAMGKGAWLRVVLREGRKRQIRETGDRLGLPVVKIIRVRIGALRLGSLKPREWRNLTPEEVAELKGQQGKTGATPSKARQRPMKSRESSRPRRTPRERGKRG